MKNNTRILALILCFSVVFSCCFSVFSYEAEEIDSAISAGIDYYKTVQKGKYEEDLGLKGSPFHAMLRAETSKIQQSDYFFMVPIYDISTVGGFKTSEEFAKAIVICILSGQNPKTAVTGIDMVEKLISLQKQDGRFMLTNDDGKLEFSLEGHLWAMIALDLINADYNRSKAINVLSNYRLENGAFSETADAPSLDLTATALMVLSKYTNPKIVEMKTTAVEFLKSVYSDGVFIPQDSGTPNVITQSFCILAMIAAGESLWNEPYTTEEFDPVKFLLSAQDESGGFWYSESIKTAGASGEHTTAEDFASAVSLCALLDMKNNRSYFLTIGEKFIDATQKEPEKIPDIIVYEAKYIWIVAGGVLLVLSGVVIFGYFISGEKRKGKIKKLKNTLQK